MSRQVGWWWPTQKKRRQLSGEGGSWSVVVALHRHPRFMASHGWADWVDGGRGREPRARYGVRGPESSFLVGASLWWQALGHKVGVRSFPGRSTERWASHLGTKGEGADGLVALVSQRAKPRQRRSNKGSLLLARLCAPALLVWVSIPGLSVAAERKRQGRWLPPDRGQQARQPAGKGQDREIGAGTWQPGRRRGRGRGLGWAGLGCDWRLRLLFAPFLWGHPPFQSVSVHVHVAAV